MDSGDAGSAAEQAVAQATSTAHPAATILPPAVPAKMPLTSPDARMTPPEIPPARERAFLIPP
ncbi:hypothetical protein GCM10017673_06600 [Streptosporangium violaceochromogenes]|nr:hypothetical protein GCM10017673_06600 [Streptosporangium violaceochromogenes]